MHNSIVLLFHLCHPVYRQRWLLKEAQTVCSNTMTLHIADIYNYHCSIYNTGSLMHGGWTHKYSGVKVNFWVWFYRESELVENDHITIFCRGNMPYVGPLVKENILCFPHAVEPWSNTIIVLKKTKLLQTAKSFLLHLVFEMYNRTKYFFFFSTEENPRVPQGKNVRDLNSLY